MPSLISHAAVAVAAGVAFAPRDVPNHNGTQKADRAPFKPVTEEEVQRINRGDTVLDVGTGTGILIPIINQYEPRWIYACDLSEAMLKQLGSKKYPKVETLLADVRDLRLPDGSIDVIFINACYGNIADKAGAFSNITRMMKTEG